MGTLKGEKEKSKLVSEKCQQILNDLLRDEDNKYCVDCDAKGPRWASWNLGIFLCIRCAGIHRNLGVHISKVKSVNLDAWTPEQVGYLQQMGNSKARAVYEANLPDNFRRPQTDSSLEAFIRAKYEQKKYIAEEWVPLPTPQPAFDIEEERRKEKEKKKIRLPKIQANTSPVDVQTNPVPRPHSTLISSPINADRVVSNNSSPGKKQASVDLLGLDVQSNGSNHLINSTSSANLVAEDDPFEAFVSAPLVSPEANNSSNGTDTSNGGSNGNNSSITDEEKDFFNQKAPASQDKKLDKETIMKLYESCNNTFVNPINLNNPLNPLNSNPLVQPQPTLSQSNSSNNLFGLNFGPLQQQPFQPPLQQQPNNQLWSSMLTANQSIPVTLQTQNSFFVSPNPMGANLASNMLGQSTIQAVSPSINSSQPDWFNQICSQVVNDMNLYGICVIDNFLGETQGDSILEEVKSLYNYGVFQEGQLVRKVARVPTLSSVIRSDKIVWVDGGEPQCSNIGFLIQTLDSILFKCNTMNNNGLFSKYNINTRTKAMIACYPGCGTRYVKHIDNPNEDGRRITSIYYLNKGWEVQRDGGLLRMYPIGYENHVADIAPLFDRVIFFWSDRRNPHEVQPAFNIRFAITVWYFDDQEKNQTIQRYHEHHQSYPHEVSS